MKRVADIRLNILGVQVSCKLESGGEFWRGKISSEDVLSCYKEALQLFVEDCVPEGMFVNIQRNSTGRDIRGVSIYKHVGEGKNRVMYALYLTEGRYEEYTELSVSSNFMSKMYDRKNKCLIEEFFFN